jgi:glycosyltransferase involved in cell wall biosynthesis
MLCKERHPDDFEIIIADDNSDRKISPDVLERKNVYVYKTGKTSGVGAAFDVGVSKANGDILFLIGSDVVVPPNWLEKVDEISTLYHDSIVCGECKHAQIDKVVGYGATIAWTMNSNGMGIRADAVQARWIRNRLAPMPFEVPCILGAAYVVHKSLYNSIRGWRGHKFFGGLEPMISIKAWLSGYRCLCDPTFPIGHYFNRYKKTSDILANRSLKPDWYFYNKMFIAETMLLPRHKEKVIRHLGVYHATEMAKKYLRDNADLVNSERIANEKMFVHDSSYLWKED